MAPLTKGQSFATKQALDDAVRALVIADNRKCSPKESDRTHLRWVCKADGCNWLVYGRSADLKEESKQFVLVKVQLQHRCTCALEARNSAASASWLGRQIAPDVRAKPRTKPRDIGIDVTTDTGLVLTYKQQLRALGAAKVEIHGSHAEGYQLLAAYAWQL